MTGVSLLVVVVVGVFFCLFIVNILINTVVRTFVFIIVSSSVVNASPSARFVYSFFLDTTVEIFL